ncbi:hypothetical protein Pmar_PMAR015256 [Perkinsus marinus ATCC 50983]|uniref:Uncharacterized protein n=1 Tax=Perkinsus marinus (strain ATCC 50983 / TXsc) TaxID=423536 RepID=C5KL59_PERM5|nr:hypothetical protein Pmar_PMAR015256 [Perkinsus marinus ATCC 50983]EER14732.1 hypothetical protein Pmar_PMAR015256 [Perkinsus marinus ATCC 50983]|eukprot:XP_002782936.1 hypothetical protein Pmar_PMAR015256 [Perkinsus marinus ATCC 50983]
MFWEADSFIEDGDDQDASESSVTPCSVPTQTTSESYHDMLLIDVRKGHKPVHVQLASPAETVSWKLYDEPRIVWGTVACSMKTVGQQSLGSSADVTKPYFAALLLNSAVDMRAQRTGTGHGTSCRATVALT